MTRALSVEEAVRPYGTTDSGIVFVDGRRRRTTYTYDELARRIGAAGAQLRAKGVRPGSTVGMTILNDAASLAAALGVWAAGATLVSLPPPPRRKNADWYRQMLSPVLGRLECDTIIASADQTEMYAATSSVIPYEVLEGGDDARPPEEPVPDIALIQFTSGSVGNPKGVALRGSAVAGHVVAIADALELYAERDVSVTWLPLYHDMGFIGFHLVPLFARVTQLIGKPTSFVLNPSSWFDLLQSEGATITGAPNFAFRLAAQAAEGQDFDLSRLRRCLCGAERVHWETLVEFHRVTAPMGLTWEAIMPVYGMAEASLAVSFPPMDRGPVRSTNGQVSVGSPLPGVEIRLEEADGPSGISIRSPWLFDGYHLSDRFEPSDEWFPTKDVGFVEGGELFVIGRQDDVVISAGRNIFAEDVEAVVTRAVQDVHACAAFRSEDGERFGVVLEIRPAEPEVLESHARTVQKVVTEVLGIRVSPVIVVRPWTIPRTSSGKVKRSASRRAHAEGAFASRSILGEFS